MPIYAYDSFYAINFLKENYMCLEIRLEEKVSNRELCISSGVGMKGAFLVSIIFQFPKKKKKAGYFYLNKIKKDKIQLLFFVSCKSLPTRRKGRAHSRSPHCSQRVTRRHSAGLSGRPKRPRAVCPGRRGEGWARRAGGGARRPRASREIPLRPLRPLRPARRAPGSPLPAPRHFLFSAPAPPARARARACRLPPTARRRARRRPRRCPRPGRVAAPPAAPRAALSRAGRAGEAARCPPPRARAPRPGVAAVAPGPGAGGAPGWAPRGGS